jgi:hypothetical protein
MQVCAGMRGWCAAIGGPKDLAVRGGSGTP